MKVHFWGVRGSVAAPGAETAKYGGNTSCVSVGIGENLIIFDAGTGLRLLGNEILRHPRPPTMDLFLSHVHWDHIQGFPFFGPVYSSKYHLQLYGAPRGRFNLAQVMGLQMRGPNFPVSLKKLNAQVTYRDLKPPEDVEIKDKKGNTVARVSNTTGNHPNGVVVYRIEDVRSGGSLVYATDTEHHPKGMDKRIASLCRDADMLIYDGMYTPEEYESFYRGFGHSTWEKGLEISVHSKVKTLAIFHHHPDHDDRFMAAFEKKVKAAARKQARDVTVIFAKEGMELEL